MRFVETNIDAIEENDFEQFCELIGTDLYVTSFVEDYFGPFDEKEELSMSNLERAFDALWNFDIELLHYNVYACIQEWKGAQCACI